jgi:prepilin-type N-terminal cleavage/methylation domain-containing protein
MMKKRFKHAFTLLELILVIIILGIVSSIGSEIIANTYENYLMQRATSRASLKTELAAQQIANYLSYRIPRTTLARNPSNLNDTLYVHEMTGGEDNTHIALEWIGEEADSFSTLVRGGWNGFCDVAASAQDHIITPGSRLDIADNVIRNLSNGAASLQPGTQNPAIFFRHLLYSKNPIVPYDAKTCMGMTPGSTTQCISTVTRNGNERLDFVLGAANNKKVIVEHYKLAWTAYAVVPLKPGSNTQPCRPDQGDRYCDLYLYYNYRPWEGNALNLANTPHELLITGVTVFKFAELSDTFRFKLCASQPITRDQNITMCKEKAIIR